MAIALLASSAFFGCDSANKATTAPNSSNGDTATMVLAATTAGDSAGTTVHGVIGAAGGSIRSANGEITVVVPAGALDRDVRLGLQPITTAVPGAIGAAWRLSPDSVRFLKPVQLILGYTDSQLVGTNPSALGLYRQNPDGTWSRISIALDTIARTANGSFPVRHLEVRTPRTPIDFVFVSELVLLPGSTSVHVNDSKLLRIIDPNPNLEVMSADVDDAPGGYKSVGTISFLDSRTLKYQAPATVPIPSTVKVSLHVGSNSTSRTVHSYITILPKPAFEGNVTGDFVSENASTTTTVHLEGTVSLKLASQTLDGHFYAITGDASVRYSRKIADSPTRKVTCQDQTMNYPISGVFRIFDLPPSKIPGTKTHFDSDSGTYYFYLNVSPPSGNLVKFPCVSRDSSTIWLNDGEGGDTTGTPKITTTPFVSQASPPMMYGTDDCKHPNIAFWDRQRFSDNMTATCGPDVSTTNTTTFQWTLTETPP